MQIICPLCHQSLSLTLSLNEKRWSCENNHSFDIAKQGYANLLPVQNKKSKQPGDNNEMVTARTRFLNTELYQPISSAVNDSIQQRIQAKNLAQPALIDAGCGEGYYTSRLNTFLSEQHIDHHILAIDISKYAIKAASRRTKEIMWFVANSNNIPVRTADADVMLCMFAPLTAAEFRRCLKDQGELLVVSSGANHLIELREKIYNDVNEKVLDPSSSLKDHFTQIETQSVEYQITLTNNNDIKDLFSMTPHYWRASAEKKQHIERLEQLSLSVDIQISSFRTRDY